jgi:hypothetical protein
LQKDWYFKKGCCWDRISAVFIIHPFLYHLNGFVVLAIICDITSTAAVFILVILLQQVTFHFLCLLVASPQEHQIYLYLKFRNGGGNCTLFGPTTHYCTRGEQFYYALR